MSSIPQTPGPFGWVARLTRWSQYDRTTSGMSGPLPPPPPRFRDATDGDLYALGDGWLSGTVGASLSSFFSEPRTRKELYILFEKMDLTDMAGSILDTYAEDATQLDPQVNRTLWITSQNPKIQQLGDDMLKRLMVEEELPSQARDLGKYGDLFERNVYRSGKDDGGLLQFVPTNPGEITRFEDKERKLLGFKQAGKKFRSGANELSYPWDFTHFRIRGRDRRYPYGTSLLHNGIRPWKQSIILEDWSLGYQVNKHPDRNLFILDTGTASEVESADVARRFKQKLRRHMMVDPGGVSGRNIGYRPDPMTPMEDIVLAVRTGSNTRVEKLSGSANAVDITPLDRVVDRFYAAVRVPKSFFTSEGGDGQFVAKASLANQSIRYARGVERLQRALKTGYDYAFKFNLVLLMSENPDDISLDWNQPGNEFAVNMAPVSYLKEMERLEVAQLRQQVALALMELSANNLAFKIAEWTAYILRDIVQAPDEVISSVLRSQADVEEREAEQIAVEAGPGPVGEAIAKRHNRKRDGTPTGELKDAGREALSVAIAARPALRESIHRCALLWRDQLPTHDMSTILPDRKSDLFKKGPLADSLTQEDIDEMLNESRDEAGIARVGAED